MWAYWPHVFADADVGCVRLDRRNSCLERKLGKAKEAPKAPWAVPTQGRCSKDPRGSWCLQVEDADSISRSVLPPPTPISNFGRTIYRASQRLYQSDVPFCDSNLLYGSLFDAIRPCLPHLDCLYFHSIRFGWVRDMPVHIPGLARPACFKASRKFEAGKNVRLRIEDNGIQR